jgi:hypothetical protein
MFLALLPRLFNIAHIGGPRPCELVRGVPGPSLLDLNSKFGGVGQNPVFVGENRGGRAEKYSANQFRQAKGQPSLRRHS